MGSDLARVSYDPTRQWRSVVAQQGRVSLEADLNEETFIEEERDRLTTLDIVGPVGTPNNGYAVTAIPATGGPAGSTPGDLVIGQGILYVGGERFELDTDVTYSSQPDWLDDSTDPLYAAPAVPSGSAEEVVFLVASEQEVSAVEDPALADIALGGPDTGQRTRLMQHFMRQTTSAGSCADALTQLETWWASQGLDFDPTTMELTSATSLVVSFPDETQQPTACQPVASGGYLGAENQMYRVAVTSVDNGVPTIVWGPDDASFLYRVSAATYDAGSSTTTLTLESQPVDSYHYPLQGQAVELLRDSTELTTTDFIASADGFVTTLTANYDSTGQTLTLSGEPPADYLSSATPQLYVRVWEGTAPAPAGTAVTLGTTGVAVTLTTSDGNFHVGDFWRFAFRPLNPAIVYPARYLESPQPPVGPRTWACPLAVVSWASGTPTVSSCVPPFTSLVNLSQGSGDCCTITVGPDDVDGGLSLPDLVAKLSGMPNTTICLEPGTYTLADPIVLDSGSDGLALKACRGGVKFTAAANPGTQLTLGLIAVDRAEQISITGIEFIPPMIRFKSVSGAFKGLPEKNVTLLEAYSRELDVAIGISVTGAVDLAISDCQFEFGALGDGNVFGAGVLARGPVEGLTITGCTFATSRAPVKVPFADLTRGVETEAPYQVTFGYVEVPSQADVAAKWAATSSATTRTATPPAAPAAATSSTIGTTAAGLSTSPAQSAVLAASSSGIAADVASASPARQQMLIDEAGAAERVIAQDANLKVAALASGGANAIVGQGVATDNAAGANATNTPPIIIPVLHDAIFEDNLFQGLTVPVLVFGKLGTIRLDRNIIRDCYGGTWLLSMAKASVLTMVDTLAVGSRAIWDSTSRLGTSAMTDRVLVLATAIGRVLPTTPPSDGQAQTLFIPAPSTTDLSDAKTFLTNLTFDISVTSDTSTSSASSAVAQPSASPTPAPSSVTPAAAAKSKGVLARIFERNTATTTTNAAIANQTDVLATDTNFGTSVSTSQTLPTTLDQAFSGADLVTGIALGSIDTGVAIILRLEVADSQVDSVVNDFDSSAALMVIDLSGTPGSLMLHDNRLRTRAPQNQTALVIVAECTVTGNVIANDVVNSKTDNSDVAYNAEMPARSLVVKPRPQLAVPAVAITGNVLIDPALLPARPALAASNLPAALKTWEYLNTITPFV